MDKFKIAITEETKSIIETFTGMPIETFLEQTRDDLLNKYQEGNRMTVKEAAEAMGVSQQFIRIGLQRNQLPFGVAVKMSSTYSYYISPKKFYEYVGYISKIDPKNGG